MNILGMGPLEILVVLLIAFIFLGPQRMVDAARLLGKASRELKRMSDELPRLIVDEEQPPTAGSGPRDRTESGGRPEPHDSNSGDEGHQSDDIPVAFQQQSDTRPSREPQVRD